MSGNKINWTEAERATLASLLREKFSSTDIQVRDLWCSRSSKRALLDIQKEAIERGMMSSARYRAFPSPVDHEDVQRLRQDIIREQVATIPAPRTSVAPAAFDQEALLSRMREIVREELHRVLTSPSVLNTILPFSPPESYKLDTPREVLPTVPNAMVNVEPPRQVAAPSEPPKAKKRYRLVFLGLLGRQRGILKDRFRAKNILMEGPGYSVEFTDETSHSSKILPREGEQTICFVLNGCAPDRVRWLRKQSNVDVRISPSRSIETLGEELFTLILENLK